MIVVRCDTLFFVECFPLYVGVICLILVPSSFLWNTCSSFKNRSVQAEVISSATYGRPLLLLLLYTAVYTPSICLCVLLSSHLLFWTPAYTFRYTVCGRISRGWSHRQEGGHTQKIFIFLACTMYGS